VRASIPRSRTGDLIHSRGGFAERRAETLSAELSRSTHLTILRPAADDPMEHRDIGKRFVFRPIRPWPNRSIHRFVIISVIALFAKPVITVDPIITRLL